jgi:hypothetical protein
VTALPLPGPAARSPSLAGGAAPPGFTHVSEAPVPLAAPLSASKAGLATWPGGPGLQRKSIRQHTMERAWALRTQTLNSKEKPRP